MATLDRPVVTIECQDALGVGILGRMAGDAVSQLPSLSAGFFNDHMALDDKRLTDAGEVEITVELSRRPDRTRLEAAMGQRRLFAEVRRAPLCEGDGEIIEQMSLIAFDREQIMRPVT